MEYNLVEAPIGVNLQVVEILGSKEFRRLMNKVGIYLGSQLTKLDSTVSHVHVTAKGRDIFLTSQMARRIIVRTFLVDWKSYWWRSFPKWKPILRRLFIIQRPILAYLLW